MTDALDRFILSLPPFAVLAAVFLLPAVEASLFVGFVIPGETAVVLGGVVASQGHLAIGLVIIAAVAGAVIGDSIGYQIGHRAGPSLKRSRLGQKLGEKRWNAVETFMERHGPKAVFFGRFTALMRAVIPAAAGTGHLPYGTFLRWNVLGGVLWATGMALIGYGAGSAYKQIESYASEGALVLLVVVVIAAIVVHRVRSRREA